NGSCSSRSGSMTQSSKPRSLGPRMSDGRGTSATSPGGRITMPISGRSPAYSRTSGPPKKASDLAVGAMEYFTNASGPGPVRVGQPPGSIGVLDALDKPMPIEIASEIGRTEGGLAIWRLTIEGDDVPGGGSSSIASSGRSRDDGAG